MIFLQQAVIYTVIKKLYRLNKTFKNKHFKVKSLILM
nr:MAG TPA: hypothetical protein [Crassvirales sp.]